MVASYERGFWGNGSKRVVEELDTDEDSDTQVACLNSTRETRFSSDPLRFTGIDMGENMPRPRRKHAYAQSAYDDSDSEQDTELDEEGYAQFSREEEEALVGSAMRRIRRAQARGKKEVKLSRKELAALENQRKRQAEGKSKKKKREQRYAVPLSQLTPISHKESRAPRTPGAPSSAELLQRQTVEPPVGWFAHPTSRLGFSDTRRPTNGRTSDREDSTSPFQYNYVRPAAPGLVSPSRHSSDPAVRQRSGSTLGNLPYSDARMSHHNPSSSVPSVPSTLDPFRYMTSGSSVGAGHYEPSTRGGASTPRLHFGHFTPDDEELSSDSDEDEDENETSHGADAGARVGKSSIIGREETIVEGDGEPTREPRVTRSKAAPDSLKPTPKRGSTGGSRKKKGIK